MGKAEGEGENWHGHVTAVTVAPLFRKLGLARQMMNLLESISEKTYHLQLKLSSQVQRILCRSIRASKQQSCN